MADKTEYDYAEDALYYWKRSLQYYLKVAAMRYLVANSTLVESERLFTALHNQLDPSLADNFIFLLHNIE